MPTWIDNHMPGKVWDEITYAFPNFHGCTTEVWEFDLTLYNACNYLPMSGLKRIRGYSSSPREQITQFKRKYYAETSFQHTNYAFITSCVCWEYLSQRQIMATNVCDRVSIPRLRLCRYDLSVWHIIEFMMTSSNGNNFRVTGPL